MHVFLNTVPVSVVGTHLNDKNLESEGPVCLLMQGPTFLVSAPAFVQAWIHF